MQSLLKGLPFSSELHLVIGSFDGVHYAHQQLINYALNQAKKNNAPSLIFSFEPLPKEFFNKDFSGRLLNANQKKSILESFGADFVVISDFEQIKDYSENQFINAILEYCDQLYLYSGQDFRMGCSGEDERYKGNRVHFYQIEDIMVEGHTCHSSEIRSLIQSGNISMANILLNRTYSIQSHTISGDKIGRSIDFPTINIKTTKQIKPQNGVYFGEIKIFQDTYPAAIYVGNRPSVHGLDLRIESHVITDFPHGEIPEGTDAEVIFLQKIAEEKKASSLEELQKMLYNYKNISLGLATERYKILNRLS